MSLVPRNDPNEWECWVDEGHLWGVGFTTRLNPYDTLDEDEEAKLLAEIRERESRRLPFGFRAGCAASSPDAGRFPKVGWLS